MHLPGLTLKRPKRAQALIIQLYVIEYWGLEVKSWLLALEGDFTASTSFFIFLNNNPSPNFFSLPPILRPQCLQILRECSTTARLEASISSINCGSGSVGIDLGMKRVFQFSSVQFSRSVVSDSLPPHESQQARMVSITDSMDMNLSKLQETVKDREA